MTDQEMLENLREVITEFVDMKPDEITFDTNMRSDLGLNSLELVNMAVAIEDKFGVEIPDREVSRIETLKDVIDVIRDYSED